MDNVIKNRIEQINGGKVPVGYKKTIVGVVPKEWNEDTLGNIFSFKNGLNKGKEAFGLGTPIINYTDVWRKRGLKKKDIKGRVELTPSEIENYNVQCGDVFFTRTSEIIEEIGYSSVLLEDVEKTVFSGFVLRARPKNNFLLKEFNQYCYSSALMRNEIQRRSSMTTRALTSGPMLSQVSINIPSKSEQAKIAEILMKWDEVIELQEQLISKLEYKRKAILQKIFDKCNCNSTLKIGECVEQRTERNDSHIKNVKSVSNKKGFIAQEEQFSKIVASEDLTNYKIVRKSDIAYNPSRINVGSIAVYKDADVGIVSPMYVVFTCKDINPKFVLLLLETARGKYEIDTLLSGSVRNSLSFTDLCKIELPIPVFGVTEIVNLFDAIESEINLHKEKLNKLNLQHIALQQYLLTGIVRV